MSIGDLSSWFESSNAFSESEKEHSFFLSFLSFLPSLPTSCSRCCWLKVNKGQSQHWYTTDIDRLLAVTVCYILSVIDCFLISMISITVFDTLPQHRSVSGARNAFSHSCTDHLSGQLTQLRCCVLTAVLSSNAGGCHKACSALSSLLGRADT